MGTTYERLTMPRGLREAVLRKCPFGNCWYCGETTGSRKGAGQVNVEHGTPVVRGGPTTYENLFPSCRGCNLLKGTRTIEEFRDLVKARKAENAAKAFALLEEFTWYLIDEQTERLRKAVAEYADGVGRVVFYGERLVR